MALISPIALEELAKVLTFGAKKYSANNWRQGFDWTRVLSAVQRHINDWAMGIDRDPETDLSHLAHAMCGIMFLLEFEGTGTGVDDRYKIERSKQWQQVEDLGGTTQTTGKELKTKSTVEDLPILKSPSVKLS